MDKNIKILESLLKDDSISIIDSIKESLTEKSNLRLREIINEDVDNYLQETRNLEKIKNASENPEAEEILIFDDGKNISLDYEVANDLLTFYNAVDKEAKKKFEHMVQKDADSYMKLVDLAREQVSTEE